MPSQTPRQTSRYIRPAAAVAAVGLAAVLAGCGDEDGSGDITTLTMTDIVDPEVSAITVLSDFDVRVIVDPDAPQAGSLRIDDNLIDDADVWVTDDGELFVGWTGYTLDVEPSEQPLLTVHIQELTSVENRSEGHVTIEGASADSVEVDIEDDDGSVTFADGAGGEAS